MNTNTKEEAHKGPIRTGKQFFWVSIAAFVVPFFTIVGLVMWIGSINNTAPGATDQAQKLLERIRPVARVVMEGDAANEPEQQEAPAPQVAAAGAQAAGGADGGKALYESTCFACHGTGAAGAPKYGDKDAWAPLIASGMDAMMDVAIHGKGAMPPRGGSQASDEQLQQAVQYMVEAAGGAPAAAAPAAAAQSAQQPATTEASADAKPEAEPPAADGGAAEIDLAAGEALYKSTCFACHGSGVAGAPKYGDKGAWAPLIASGMDAMMDVAIHGKGAMPARGGSQASDEQLRAAVQYMVNAAQ